MRTPTGDYRIDFFNKYGEQIRGESMIAPSLVRSHAMAIDNLQCPGMLAASYTVMRCVFNSLDKDANL
ncbi:MAG: hypothetical protein ACXW04_01160 [Methylobacter sp.]